MIAVLVAVISLRLGALIYQDAVDVYLSGMASTFREMLRFDSGIQPLILLMSVIGLVLYLNRKVSRAINVMTLLPVLMTIGVWTSVILLPATGDNQEPIWILIVIMINLIISILIISLLPALLVLFMKQIIRPE